MAEPTAPAVEVEVDHSETDSAFSAWDRSESTSIISTVRRHEWKHGRRYHGYQSGSYSFPNDDEEQDRLDMIHHVFYRLVGDRLFLAPITPEGCTVLDIGTGTGIWPIHFGDMHPGATIIGNDLSPIQPDWVPPNVKFLVDDVELDWAEPAKYDYIHCRYMAASIKDWPRLVHQIFENLNPGGWVEFQETDNVLYSEDGSLAPDNPMVQMMEGLTEASAKIGRTMNPAPLFATWASEAGFVKVSQHTFKLPVGSWPKDPLLKDLGTLMGYNFFEGVAAFTAVLFQDVLGWSRAEVEVLNANVRRASRNKKVHPMFDFLVVTAQKPE